jgi:hypothetical protein
VPQEQVQLVLVDSLEAQDSQVLLVQAGWMEPLVHLDSLDQQELLAQAA